MDTQALAGYLGNTLFPKIPMAKEMEIRVAEYDGAALTLRAPLGRNVNDKGTAFGGSLYSIAVLAGWGLLSVKLKEENLTGEVVIHESTISYRLPVSEDLEARCEVPEEHEYSRFIEDFRAKGMGKITLEVRIMRKTRVAVRFRGDYVACRTDESAKISQ